MDLLPVIGLMLSTALEFVSLWQIEIVSWNTDEEFEFPFFFIRCNKWVARDFWYAINVLGWILMGVSAYFLVLVNPMT